MPCILNGISFHPSLNLHRFIGFSLIVQLPIHCNNFLQGDTIMKKLRLAIFLGITSLFLGIGILSTVNIPEASASHVVHYVPKAYRHTWHGWDGDWITFKKHSLSAGYLEQRNVYAGVGFSRIYSSKHIRVYSDNMPVYDLKLKHFKNKFYRDKQKHWYLTIHALGESGSIQYRK